MSKARQRILVVGNGMVGHKFIENMLAYDCANNYEMVTFSEEPRLAYDRVRLSHYFSGSTADDLMLPSKNFYRQHGVGYVLNDKVTALYPEQQCVHTRSGRAVEYDSLVLATGSSPFVPPIVGVDQPHCLVYRTIEDLEAIKLSASLSRKGVVIGGGLLGLEAANALKQLGLEVDVVEFAPQLMAAQLDDGGGALLRRKIEALGVTVHTQKNTQAIVAAERSRYCMEFADGSCLETDMIIFSAGIRPRDELARQAGLALGERGGIVIDNQCRTSAPKIYAIGECALWNNRIFGLVAPGYQMAKVAASQIVEGRGEFTGADMSTKLKLLGVDVASIGDARCTTPGAQVYSFHDGINQIYKRLVVSENGKHLLGAVLVGDVGAYGTLQQLCVNELELPASPEQLILPAIAGGAAAMGVEALPDQTFVCSCHEVTKGQIRDAVANGAVTMADVKQCTKAGTGCGGCVGLATQVLNSQLARRGVEISTDLCEHFAFTRQQLYHMVRVEELRTFEEVIAKHGTGLGCDICKPTIASILASCWNDYILKQEHAALQDTNDYFLANMQKNGTYSVVPRIAGGEITADKLIVLGQVAKQYNLYTKITGGQRIDLFGAQQHQLPEIWKALVDAGFETGHAYGKSVRTVKSCVGSTWCRYGVLDSMTMALTIEHRYKGLRSPHKLKFAVSGCTRECAEAQSKDVGVIATEKGWNLYVGGNGGMKPRHADLFASGLDDKRLIQYIDRFLMFYIRTADRLQRTSVWMDNLSGGLDYLKDVVIADKLGICSELETQIAQVLAAYQCEWKTTIEDPEKLKRFQTFVNSTAKDDTVVFVQEREQIRPAADEEVIRMVTETI